MPNMPADKPSSWGTQPCPICKQETTMHTAGRPSHIRACAKKHEVECPAEFFKEAEPVVDEAMRVEPQAAINPEVKKRLAYAKKIADRDLEIEVRRRKEAPNAMTRPQGQASPLKAAVVRLTKAGLLDPETEHAFWGEAVRDREYGSQGYMAKVNEVGEHERHKDMVLYTRHRMLHERDRAAAEWESQRKVMAATRAGAVEVQRDQVGKTTSESEPSAEATVAAAG